MYIHYSVYKLIQLERKALNCLQGEVRCFCWRINVFFKQLKGHNSAKVMVPRADGWHLMGHRVGL